MLKDLIPWGKDKKSSVPAKKSSDPFMELHRRMNKMFDNFFEDFDESFNFPELSKKAGMVSPSFEVSETDDAVKVSAELPGMDEKDLDVSLDNNMLTIKGEKKQEHEEKDKNYHVSERSYGSFRRSLSLPEGLDTDKIKAQFKKGVLNITLPKTKEAKDKCKKIDISKE